MDYPRTSRPRPVWLWIALCAVLFAAGCENVGPDMPPADGGPDACIPPNVDETIDFINANKSCTQDSDCVWAAGSCLPVERRENCTTLVSVNKDYDPTRWSELTGGHVTSCPLCIACTIQLGPPVCNNGICGGSYLR